MVGAGSDLGLRQIVESLIERQSVPKCRHCDWNFMNKVELSIAGAMGVYRSRSWPLR
jgi:hypothetical protein